MWDRDTRRAGPQRDRLAGHAHRHDLSTSCRATAARTVSRSETGLPLATYFSGPKVRWILDNVDGARERAEAGDLLFGTIDTWLIWKLTGGPDGGLHVTDVTNASRTMLMDLDTLDWDDEIARRHRRAALDAARDPRRPATVYGEVHERRVRRRADRGRPRATSRPRRFGQACFAVGEAKNTYGTGNFLLLNTGTEAVQSKNGLLTTVGYKIGDEPRRLRLEGSIAITGALVQWLRDNLKLINAAARGRGARASGRRQRRRATSCRRSRACSRRTGSPTRAACSRA